METGLRLLMRDGAVHITFAPKLTADQYSELLKAAESASTQSELKAAMESLAAQWGSQVNFD
jgi:hypothetical protein